MTLPTRSWTPGRVAFGWDLPPDLEAEAEAVGDVGVRAAGAMGVGSTNAAEISSSSESPSISSSVASATLTRTLGSPRLPAPAVPFVLPAPLVLPASPVSFTSAMPPLACHRSHPEGYTGTNRSSPWLHAYEHQKGFAP